MLGRPVLCVMRLDQLFHRMNLRLVKGFWFYQEFFEKKGLSGAENCIKDNVMYIHTSYLDVNPKFIPENIIRDYERLQRDNPDEYDNVVLGGWIENPEGILLPRNSLRFDSMEKLNTDLFDYRFAVGDPADKGGDKYSMPFMYVSAKNGFSVYVTDVIHNGYGIMQNTETILKKCTSHHIDDLLIESNGVGLAAIVDIKNKIRTANTSVKPFASTDEKEMRILGNYEFIQRHFVFDAKFKEKPEYNSFMSDLTGYIRGADNKHKKDAIDVLSTAAWFLKQKFRSILY